MASPTPCEVRGHGKLWVNTEKRPCRHCEAIHPYWVARDGGRCLPLAFSMDLIDGNPGRRSAWPQAGMEIMEMHPATGDLQRITLFG